MEKITGEILISASTFSEIKREVENISDFKEKIEEVISARITEILEVILVGAIILDSSDLHIEPEEEQAKIRVRIDGILEDVIFIERKVYENLLSRIKLLSGIKLNITDRAQDGRFSIFLEKMAIEIRVSTLPAEYGESIVLRILNPKSLIDLEQLGLREDILEKLKVEIKRPNGMIIVTGPTGAGKTTTLYAFLKKIQRPEIKIITIEDPIEYHLEGISQTQVNPSKGYDFANGLKSIMRQDPDVILVGEVRDLETVQIALQAALTGHLVLTTLHTNDAAGTIARLVALGAKLVDIAPALNLVVAQRLVRKVCKKCRVLAKISSKEFEELKKGLSSLSKEIFLPLISKSLKIPKAKGCQDCNFTGYRGRIGLFEILIIDDEIEKFILRAPSIPELKEMAIKKGMITLHQDGLIKVLEGITTFEEIKRVVGE